jgi:A118 family predicted phage portal protein
VEAWKDIEENVYIANLDKPLFAYFRIPGANSLDKYSPLGLSIFSNAVTELKSLDMAISRKDGEIEDSKHITFVGQTVMRTTESRGFKLPRFVKGMGIGIDDSGNSSIREHTATLLTDSRIKDINFTLSLIGVKCGFSPGMFVLDGQKSAITATQVEADDRDTIQTIKTDRDALKTALERAIYGADVMATLYNTAPMGEYELSFNFGDITYNYEEDKALWRSYAVQNWIPKWVYLMKFEKMSEEEAKAMIAEAEAANMQLELFQIKASATARGGD